MMQDILYRAKSEKTGEWLYGSLVIDSGSDEDGPYCRAYIVTKNEDNTLHHFAEVEPETIGRYVGITCYNCNRDDQRPFQGDIVEVYRSKQCDFEKDEPIEKNAIVVDEHSITHNGAGRWFTQDTVQIRVIGNVYDTPELVGDKYADLYRFYFGFNPDEYANTH